jgi:hypothetical protein
MARPRSHSKLQEICGFFAQRMAIPKSLTGRLREFTAVLTGKGSKAAACCLEILMG